MGGAAVGSHLPSPLTLALASLCCRPDVKMSTSLKLNYTLYGAIATPLCPFCILEPGKRVCL